MNYFEKKEVNRKFINWLAMSSWHSDHPLDEKRFRDFVEEYIFHYKYYNPNEAQELKDKIIQAISSQHHVDVFNNNAILKKLDDFITEIELFRILGKEHSEINLGSI